ncbi:uncharacterized protein LOC18051093, partial [Citrus clementina]|uniref:uncharacterized protein LOC18051093 n=1 Tax=Citrus clementina TaxID=85681 RepID=UPI000CED791E
DPLFIALLSTIYFQISFSLPGFPLDVPIIGRFILAPIVFLVFLIHKYRTTLQTVDNVEKFLHNHQSWMPKRYSYPEIIAVTNHFTHKLGQGGFGSVYKGQLHTGRLIAVKMLENSKFSAEEFINEVSTIGRIHHVNVVQLLGFCSEGSKRALVYEFMPNGSLDRHIFPKESRGQSFSWEKLHEVALGTARGIEYLHNGCDVCILHFDIKPYNILLDHNFIPKVSDFGLSKFHLKENDFVSISAVRGTIGYIAPELILRNFGTVSCKSDVYGFGMVLLEMTVFGGYTSTRPAMMSRHLEDETYVSDLSVGGFTLGKHPACSNLFLHMQESVERREKKRKCSEETIDVGGSSAQGGDLRLNKSVTLKEIANEVREKTMYERIERMEKQMETLTTILHELRSERRGVHKEGVRSGGMTPGHDNMMRGRTTRRFGGEGGNSSLRGERHRREDQSPRRQTFDNDDGVANAKEKELRQHLHDVEQERDQVAACDPGRAVQLEEEVKAADRPSMTKVLEMLEGSIDDLQMPPKPFFSSSRHISGREIESDSSTEFYALYNCTEKAASERTPFEAIGPINCLGSENNLVYIIYSEYLMEEMPPSCRKSRTVEIPGGLPPQDVSTTARARPVVLGWEALDGCYHCENSGNYCGFNTTSNSTICVAVKHQKHELGPLSVSLISTGTSIGGIVLSALVIFLIYKSRESEKEKETQLKVEKFLENYRTVNPTRYTYKELKKITSRFKHRLGQGGYGSVFRGKLFNRIPVAVKMLEHLKGNGQEFINEVATIGRIHHFHIVRLLGFCSEGNRRALIYEFMPNGSLEKFIFSKTNSSSHRPLSWEKLRKIAFGVARGVEYLHQGCNQRILHFDIKPHNILLDHNFQPKISDFGLAKLCSKDISIVSLTAARGTAGYIAPELFSRNFGEVSYKSDVYSYGMMLLEMGGDLELRNVTEIESMIARKLCMIGLWCIQVKPADRPSMTKVLEMLEGSIDDLQMPPKHFFSFSRHVSGREIESDSSTELLVSESIECSFNDSYA